MDKKIIRLRRSKRLRCHMKKLDVTRLVIYRTSQHMYAQVIDSNSKVLVVASTLEKEIKEQLKITGNKHAAAIVGQVIAERALKKGINDVSFDRSGFKYHGRVKILAETARKFGMKF